MEYYINQPNIELLYITSPEIPVFREHSVFIQVPKQPEILEWLVTLKQMLAYPNVHHKTSYYSLEG